MRRLRGWEPRTVTEYEYDEDGRVVASVTSTEPEYEPTELALLLAAKRAENMRGPHGVPMDIATDPAIKSRIKVDAVADFVAEKIARTRKSYETEYGHQDLSGIFFSASIEPE